MAPGQTSTPILRSSLNSHTLEQPQQPQQQQPTPSMPSSSAAPTSIPPVAASAASAMNGGAGGDSGGDLHNVNLSSPPPQAPAALPATAMKQADFY